MTADLIRNCKELEEFYKELSEFRQKNRKQLKVFLKPIKRDTHLLDKLLAAEETTQAQNVINNYWKELWKETEGKRYSQESKIAYKTLRRITKYHVFEKRDGAVIHQVKDEDGNVTDRNQVDQLLAKTLMEIQVDPKEPHIERKVFPKLSELSAKDFTLNITNQSSSGKAIAYDCLSDSMFKYHIKEEELNKLSEEEILEKTLQRDL